VGPVHSPFDKSPRGLEGAGRRLRGGCPAFPLAADPRRQAGPVPAAEGFRSPPVKVSCHRLTGSAEERFSERRCCAGMGNTSSMKARRVSSYKFC
jgi:hypothetical protein